MLIELYRDMFSLTYVLEVCNVRKVDWRYRNRYKWDNEPHLLTNMFMFIHL